MIEGTIQEIANHLNVTRRALEAFIVRHRIPQVGTRRVGFGFNNGVCRVYRLADILQKRGEALKSPTDPDNLSIAEAAAILGVEYHHVYVRVVAAKLVPVGHRRTGKGPPAALYRRKDVLRVGGNEVRPPSSPPQSSDRFPDWYERTFGHRPLAGVDYSRADRKEEN